MKTIAAGTFKAQCLAIMNEVQARREAVIITRRGHAIAKLVPVETSGDGIYHFLRGKGAVTGNIISPVLAAKEWGNLI